MVRTWEAFWFSEGSTFSLGLFRILFALLLYREITTTLSKSLFAVEGGFHRDVDAMAEELERLSVVLLAPGER